MKSEEMNKAIKELTEIDTNDAVITRVCPFCGKPATEFRDELSKRESEISGLCQRCQDDIF